MKLKSILAALTTSALAALSIVAGAGPAQAGANNCGSWQIDAIHSDTFYIDKRNNFDANYIGFKITNHSGSSASGANIAISLAHGTISLASGESSTRNLGTVANSASAYVYFFAKSSATGDVTSTTTISYTFNDGASDVCSLSNSITKVDDVLDTNASTITSVSVSPATTSIKPGTDVTVTVVGNSGNIGNGDNNDPKSIMLAPVVRSANFDASHYRLKSVTYVAGAGACTLPDLIRNINVINACDNGYTATYVFETLAAGDQTIASQIDGQTYIASGANIKHPGVKTAKLLPLVKDNVTVTYNGNKGTGSVASQTSGSAIDLSENGFTYACHIFAGWNTKANGTGDNYATTDSYSGTSSITLYAQWTVDPSCSPEELAAAEGSALAETGSSAPLGLAFIALAMVAAGAVLRRKRA